ncbi:hypothetical protein HN832_01640 [archaeon]|jgi:hypothetical protein|nr:hypothetical protein [archaeon]MBT4373058.1 hypothetical protein [archaeon]MBT4531403.1 hypothetical protein [archaeon]MBT7001419.1 hypothetical protein [archaeon]MBT7282095.1 hypothetical protein [archaeon]
MDLIKDSFKKVKQDINQISKELNSLKLIINENNQKIAELCEILYSMNESNKQINKKIETNTQEISKISQNYNSTDRQTNPTTSTDTSTDTLPLKSLKDQNIAFSIGNQGVSTDRQTDTSTDRQTQNTQEIQKKTDFDSHKQIDSFDNALNIINSLDNIKKEIRLKFKRLTEQELLVFSTIYQLDDEIGYADYKGISLKLNLSESSIRDYTLRLIKKGVPVEKTKINNKQIQLKISHNLKKIASLSTILQLRDL